MKLHEEFKLYENMWEESETVGGELTEAKVDTTELDLAIAELKARFADFTFEIDYTYTGKKRTREQAHTIIAALANKLQSDYPEYQFKPKSSSIGIAGEIIIEPAAAEAAPLMIFDPTQDHSDDGQNGHYTDTLKKMLELVKTDKAIAGTSLEEGVRAVKGYWGSEKETASCRIVFYM